MKRLKTFEELDPKTYRRAGASLYNMGKVNRGNKLRDYGYEKEFGIYNMHFANTNLLIESDIEFTSPKYQITVSQNKRDIHELGPGSVKIKDSDVENMINNWFNGTGDLGFNIHFWFTPISSKNYTNTHPLFGYKNVTMFCMEFLIAPHSALEESGGNHIGNVIDLWNEVRGWYQPGVYLTEPVGTYFGIFSDRKSANRFKRDVYNKVIEESKDVISEIFSQLGGDTEYLEMFNNEIKNIRVNRLYDDEADKKNISYTNKWFNGNSIIPGTDLSDY